MEYEKLVASRLYLSPFKKDDCTLLSSYLNNLNIYNMTLHIPFPYTLNDAISYYEKCQQKFLDIGMRSYGIYKKDDCRLIGCISISFDKSNNSGEVAYWIGEEFWNNGYASEALGSVLENAFNKDNYNKVFAYHYKKNKSSERVMIKNNMKLDGCLREHIIKDSVYYDLNLYSILQREFNK